MRPIRFDTYGMYGPMYGDFAIIVLHNLKCSLNL